ncbi:hypothetical protein EV360DRAFT_71451, partial [Lentinula raphanica]
MHVEVRSAHLHKYVFSYGIFNALRLLIHLDKLETNTVATSMIRIDCRKIPVSSLDVLKCSLFPRRLKKTGFPKDDTGIRNFHTLRIYLSSARSFTTRFSILTTLVVLSLADWYYLLRLTTYSKFFNIVLVISQQDFIAVSFDDSMPVSVLWTVVVLSFPIPTGRGVAATTQHTPISVQLMITHRGGEYEHWWLKTGALIFDASTDEETWISHPTEKDKEN